MGRLSVNRAHVEPYLRTLTPPERRRIRAALRILATESERKSLDIQQLRTDTEGPPVFRLRIGNHRVIYSRDGPRIRVHRAFAREDGYGWLERS